jgi:hypothetical protein
MEGKMTRKRFGYLVGVLLVLGVVAYLGLKLYIENDARKRIHLWANQSAKFAGLSYQSLEVGLFTRTIQVGQVSLQIKDTDSPISIDRLILYSFDIENEIPSFMHVQMKGIHIGQGNSFTKGVSPLLAQIGYAEINADVTYAYRYDPVKKDLEIQNILIRVADAGQLQMTAQVNSLDLALVKSVPNNPLMLISLVPAVAISGISLNFEDDSLTRRLIQLGARQSDQTEEQFVSGISLQLNHEIQKQKQPAGTERLQAIENFIKNPGVIEMVVSPRQPIPLMRFVMMENAEQLIDLLNITINYQAIKQKK